MHDKLDIFRGDNDGLVKAMNDVTNTARRDVVSFVKEDLKARESEWKDKSDETTLDLMWHMFNGVVMKHAKMFSARQSTEMQCAPTSKRKREDLRRSQDPLDLHLPEAGRKNKSKKQRLAARLEHFGNAVDDAVDNALILNLSDVRRI